MASITESIREAIRVPHSAVNRMNSDHIRGCLIGERRSRPLYALGFSCYTEMYLGFEAAWTALTNAEYGPGTIGGPRHMDDPGYSARIATLCTLLRVEGLPRTARLKADIKRLRSDPVTARLVADRPHGKTYEDIRRRIMNAPHKLLAYAWVLYSALFNGGHFIRRQLLKAGPGFWGLSDDEDITSFPEPLSFWSVSDDSTFRDQFKSRANEAGSLLTAEERQDVVEESVSILCRCKEMTDDLVERTAGWLVSGSDVADCRDVTRLDTADSHTTIANQV
ncbi:hypothetical protein ABOM_012134 [Aspergillus bombycis]|uniref:Heme-binding peroxidase n=1 Tax=Aspergillus bombycis TaxID=109264 RepID=A0A1F7ZJU3_9EURO|nr:hypothetical protein ABOM_012134 [Aspergillus bombycis]OGM39398.1 hypothetical protein ABOM_012134 [Aspergillus bombycis]